MALELKAIKVILGMLAVCILGGCSMPYRLTLHNRAQQAIVVEFPDGARTTIASGQSAEFTFNEPFMRVYLIFDNAKHTYHWRYPSRELMDESRSPRRFAASFGADGKIYAEKMLNTGEVQTVSQQPAGFPLLPQR